MRGCRVLSAVMAVVAVSAALALPAAAQTEDVPPEQDDPPGCTTATSEDDDGCGAQGRDHFGNAGHLPPIDACATTTAPTGSTITRITPTGPTREDGSLAFTSGACVYLPPGYEQGKLRYPVVYLLHGGGGDQADWKTFGDAQRILDEAYAADPANAVIAVLPDGRSGQWHDFLDGTFRIETYVLRHLVPAVDARFRTIDDRSGRAVIGLSNGGYGALHLAAKAPDLFVAAGSTRSGTAAPSTTGRPRAATPGAGGRAGSRSDTCPSPSIASPTPPPARWSVPRCRHRSGTGPSSTASPSGGTTSRSSGTSGSSSTSRRCGRTASRSRDRDGRW